MSSNNIVSIDNTNVNDHQARELQAQVIHIHEAGGTFSDLFFQIRADPNYGGIPDDELMVVSAMCLLGPANSAPPADIRRDLLDIFRRSVPPMQQLNWVMDFVIAYGCGKWRAVQQGGMGWNHLWAGAINVLLQTLKPAVEEANFWLYSYVVGFPARTAQDILSDAHILAMRLIRPLTPLYLLSNNEELSIRCMATETKVEALAGRRERSIPPGAKYVFSVDSGGAILRLPSGDLSIMRGTKLIITATDVGTEIRLTGRVLSLVPGQTASIAGPATLQIWECSCGNVNCEERHRLAAWDPSKATLRDFLFSAVKGPSSRIKVRSFITGMYFALLSEEGF